MNKTAFHRIMRLLSGRLARNIYFWCMVLWLRLEVRPYTPLKTGLNFFLLALLAVLFYGNNLLLAPRLLARRKYVRYLISYAALVLLVALLYAGTIKVAMHFHPDIEPGMISALITGGETRELSVSSLLQELVGYYLILFFAGLIFAMSWYVLQYWQLLHKVEEIRKKQLQTELAFLRNQINPHFLFNTLNNLYTLTLRKSDNAPRVVEGLASIMRYFLQDAVAETVSVEKEKEVMEAYIAIELLRLTNKEGLHFVIETDRHYEIPPLLWVPVLENVFKHGTRFISDKYEVEYRFTIHNSRMHIFSRNTFKQQHGASAETFGGTGHANLRKRLQLLFPERHELITARQDGYFITDLKVNLNGIN